MRGSDNASGSLFSYVDLEARIQLRHPQRLIRRSVNEALASLGADCALHRFRSPLDRAREADPREPVADPVLDPLGAAVDGTDEFLWLPPVMQEISDPFGV